MGEQHTIKSVKQAEIAVGRQRLSSSGGKKLDQKRYRGRKGPRPRAVSIE